MSNESENFEQLQRLLRFKRHEQPPPGYFNDFSRQVIAGIRAGGRTSNLDNRLGQQLPWLKRFLTSFETKPIFAGAFGATVCAVLIAGIMWAERVDVQPMPAVAERSLTPSDIAQNDSLSPAPVMANNNTNLGFPSLFDQIPLGEVQQASFGTPAGK